MIIYEEQHEHRDNIVTSYNSRHRYIFNQDQSYNNEESLAKYWYLVIGYCVQINVSKHSHVSNVALDVAEVLLSHQGDRVTGCRSHHNQQASDMGITVVLHDLCRAQVVTPLTP